jgi:hypothetical protein
MTRRAELGDALYVLGLKRLLGPVIIIVIIPDAADVVRSLSYILQLLLGRVPT